MLEYGIFNPEIQDHEAKKYYIVIFFHLEIN